MNIENEKLLEIINNKIKDNVYDILLDYALKERVSYGKIIDENDSKDFNEELVDLATKLRDTDYFNGIKKAINNEKYKLAIYLAELFQKSGKKIDDISDIEFILVNIVDKERHMDFFKYWMKRNIQNTKLYSFVLINNRNITNKYLTSH